MRTLGPVSAPFPSLQTLVKAWGRVDGGGTPVLSDNYGIASITDATVGMLDVTLMVPFESSTSYAVIANCMNTEAAVNQRATLSSTTAPSTTAFRIINSNLAGTTADPVGATGGYHFIVLGV